MAQRPDSRGCGGGWPPPTSRVQGGRPAPPGCLRVHPQPCTLLQYDMWTTETISRQAYHPPQAPDPFPNRRHQSDHPEQPVAGPCCSRKGGAVCVCSNVLKNGQCSFVVQVSARLLALAVGAGCWQASWLPMLPQAGRTGFGHYPSAALSSWAQAEQSYRNHRGVRSRNNTRSAKLPIRLRRLLLLLLLLQRRRRLLSRDGRWSACGTHILLLLLALLLLLLV